MKVAKSLALLFLITVTLFTLTTNAVDTNDLNHLINMQLNQQSVSNNSTNLDELEKIFFKKCHANDAQENVKQLQREFGVIEDRLEYLIKWYKPNDFCTVSDQIKTSVYNFANYAKDCLPSKDIKRANVLNAIIKIVDDFFCFKDGDRLLMFLAEGGDDCLNTSAETLRKCSKESFASDFNSTADFAKLLYFFIAENKCIVMDSFWSCIISDVKTNCKSTAVRILTDVFDSTKFASNCNKTKQNKREILDDEKRLYNFFSTRCGESNYQLFLGGINSLSYCFQTGYQRIHATADPKEFCKQEGKLLKECFYNGVDQISSCFTKDEKFLKDFLKVSLKNMLKFVCEDDAKHLKEYFSDSGKVCSKKIVDASSKDDGELEHCLDRIFSPSGGTVTKNELCRDLNVAEECTFRYINKTCPENKMYQMLGKGFLHSLQSPCGSSCVDCWNLFVFVFISIVIAKFL